MKRKFKAVTHIESHRNFKKVYELAMRVYTNMLANPTVFTNPTFALALFLVEITKLGNLIVAAESGNHEKVQERNLQSMKVLNILYTEAYYVDTVANGDQSIILLSGFDINEEPAPHAIPDAVDIEKVVRYKTPHSIKIFVNSVGEKVTYNVEIRKAGEGEDAWKLALQTTNSRGLILEGLERGVEIFIRIAARNARGQSDWSEVVSFIPQ